MGEKLEEEVEFEVEEGRQFLKVGVIFGAILIFVSIFFLFQWQKTNLKLKESKAKIQEMEKSLQDFQKKYEDLNNQLIQTRLDFERILEEIGTFYRWKEIEIEGVKFSYPEKWGKLTLVGETKDKLYFSAANTNIEEITFFKSSGIFAFVEKKTMHFNACATSTPFYDKVASLIFPGKRLIPVYSLTFPIFIRDCNELRKMLPLGIIDFSLSPDLKYVSFLVYGFDWSVPKFIRIDNGENILEKLIQQYWFDPLEDIYWLADGKMLALATLPLFIIPGYSQYTYGGYSTNLAPNQIAIFLSEIDNPENLKKIYSLDISQDPNQFFGNLYISENKLYFSLFHGRIDPIRRKRSIEKKREFFYDLNSNQVVEIGVTPTPTPKEKFKVPGL